MSFKFQLVLPSNHFWNWRLNTFNIKWYWTSGAKKVLQKEVGWGCGCLASHLGRLPTCQNVCFYTRPVQSATWFLFSEEWGVPSVSGRPWYHSIAISAKVHQQHGLTSYIMLMLATQGFDLVHLLLSQPVKRAIRRVTSFGSCHRDKKGRIPL